MSTRSKDFLVVPQAEFVGSKLPSNGEVLSVILYHLRLKKTSLRDVTLIVVREIVRYWEMARIPMMRKDNIVTKMEKLHQEYELLKKGKSRRSDPQIAREEAFKTRLVNVFDVAHADALKTMTNAEDRAFLLAQREPGRQGKMGTVDTALAGKEARRAQRKAKEACQRRRSQEEATTSSSFLHLESTTSSEASTDENDSIFEVVGATRPSKLHKRASENIVSPLLAAALDRTKMTDRSATYVLTETARSLGQNVDELNINRSSIRRHRIKYRAVEASKLKEEFQADTPIVVHWDGKLMQDLTGKEHVDRLPILVSGKGVAQLLQVAKLPSGSGMNIANAVVTALGEWGVQDQVVGLSFDTTSANTGRNNGACFLIEQKLNKDLLHLPCRHHILELIVQTVFSHLLGPSSAPEVLVFKRFQAQWERINCKDFFTGIQSPDAQANLDCRDECLRWALEVLEERKDLRDDYKELVELMIIFLGGTPAEGVHFRAPGPMHLARWMSKLIYSFKVWMFRHQFRLTAREESALWKVCVFAVRVYTKVWMEASFPAQSPQQHLDLIKVLDDYDKVDPDVGQVAMKKFSKHLWYLSEELVALAFFDHRVSASTKQKMRSAMLRGPIVGRASDDKPAKRISLPNAVIKDLQLEDFVTKRSMGFFKKLNLNCTFLDLPDPDDWYESEVYKESEAVVRSLPVVNDHAERGVALIKEFNRSLTKNEEQLQFLLHVVSEHRKKFPDSRKKTLREETRLS